MGVLLLLLLPASGGVGVALGSVVVGVVMTEGLVGVVSSSGGEGVLTTSDGPLVEVGVVSTLVVMVTVVPGGGVALRAGVEVLRECQLSLFETCI